MTTTPFNLNTCPVDQLYQACLAADEVDQLILLDVLMERFGNAEGWAWMVRQRRSPMHNKHDFYYWWMYTLETQVWQRLQPTHEATFYLHHPTYFAYYATEESALLDCARAAQAAIDAGEIER